MEHVLANVPPPLDSGETAGPWLSRKYSATPLREFVESTPVIDVLALEWMLAEAKIKELETGIESVKNKLRDAIGSEDAAGVDGPFGRISWRQDKNGKRSLRPKWK
jgi:predicted phage-related endonuclease